jgi:hypothetical protein
MDTSRNQKSERLKRGSNPPYIGLVDSFSIVRSIYEDGGGQASYELMSRITGNSHSSSSFIKKVGALKSYGLITEQNETIFLTDQGLAIAAPKSQPLEALAKKSALQNIAVFNKIYERHKGKLLPADEFLKNIIEQDAGIPRDLSSEWAKAFRVAARAAGLIYDRPDGKTQIIDNPLIGSREDHRGSGSSEGQPQTIGGTNTTERTTSAIIPTTLSPMTASGNTTRFELSDGRVAEFSIPFGISSKDAKRLKSYLEGLKLIIDAAIGEADELNT